MSRNQAFNNQYIYDIALIFGCGIESVQRSPRQKNLIIIYLNKSNDLKNSMFLDSLKNHKNVHTYSVVYDGDKKIRYYEIDRSKTKISQIMDGFYYMYINHKQTLLFVAIFVILIVMLFIIFYY